MMKTNVIEYTFKQTAKGQYAINYTVTNSNGEIVAHEAARPYRPVGEAPDTMNEARRRINQNLHNMLARGLFKLEGRTRIICANPDKDFYSRAEMREYNQNNKHKQEPATPVVDNSERLYEVVQVNEVWTIRKRTEPYYTKEQAQKVLMERILQGAKR